jgi:hypothetical protein
MMKKLSTRTKVIILSFLAVLTVYALNNRQPSNGCVDITLGNVQLSVPQQNLTPRTPRKDTSGNFIFAFDSNVKGVDCPVGCNELFVHIASEGVSTPERQWVSRDSQFTGRISGKYKIYHDRYDRASTKPLRDILVSSDAVRPQDEFYSCDLEGSGENPLCIKTIVTENGFVADFPIPRKVLSRAREAASFVAQAIDQFSENHAKGIFK